MTKFEKDYLFEGLNLRKASNKYYKADRVSEDQNKVVIRVDDCQLFKTNYGYGFIVGNNKVVWLKGWQVLETNWYTPEYKRDVVLTKDYYNVKESTREFDDIVVGECASDSDFEKANGYHSWQDIIDIASVQKELMIH